MILVNLNNETLFNEVKFMQNSFYYEYIVDLIWGFDFAKRRMLCSVEEKTFKSRADGKHFSLHIWITQYVILQTFLYCWVYQTKIERPSNINALSELWWVTVQSLFLNYEYSMCLQYFVVLLFFKDFETAKGYQTTAIYIAVF